MVGSPEEEGQRQFDEARTNNLSDIQNQLVNYWVNKTELPESLAALADGLGYFTVPVDPETEAAYEYAKTGQYAFELCAAFSLPSGTELNPKYTEPMMSRGSMEQTWIHGAGRVCFSRTIDPEMHKQNGRAPTLPVEKMMPQ